MIATTSVPARCHQDGTDPAACPIGKFRCWDHRTLERCRHYVGRGTIPKVGPHDMDVICAAQGKDEP